jgi:hypothetical protein
MTQQGCFISARSQQAFLSLETPQERRALPYALLVDVEISADSTMVKLSFSHYIVTVRGSRLDEIYQSIRAAECAVIMPGKRSDADTPHGSKPSMSVTDIRLKRLQPLS